MRIINGILLASICFCVSANTLTTANQTRSLCQTAVNHLSKGNVNQSFNSLKPFWPMPAAELDNLAYQTRSQLNMVSSRFGKPIGIDYIRTQKAGQSFLKHTYIVKYEKHALSYMCVFYKPNDSWLVNSVGSSGDSGS